MTDLRRLGQTTRVGRSTLQEVREKIAELRARTAESTKAKEYDFQSRMAELKAAEAQRKADRKEKKQRQKDEEAAPQAVTGNGETDEMAAMMGFGTFGGGARR